MTRRLIIILVLLAMVILPGSALAQDYYFQNPQKVVHVFWNEDGTQSLLYVLAFQNDPSGHAIEFVDLGLPNANYDINTIKAKIDEQEVTFISAEEFQGNGSGVAFGLESRAIPPGGSGIFTAEIGLVEGVLYPDDNDPEYVSAVFGPAYFDSSAVYGITDTTVIFHLPPGIQPEEPRWHNAPSGFNEQPETGFDQQNRITYTWHNSSARPDTYYEFGASFPARYIPAESVVRIDPFSNWLSNINLENLLPIGCIGLFVLFFAFGIFNSQKRRLQYLPPKITIEGQGIKRGLTAVEAAILLEQPLDKVLSMILFAVIKKEAVQVANRDPLELEFSTTQPAGLHGYEQDFINAFRSTGKARQGELQNAIINLVKTISNKMRGFSSGETKQYYRSIIKRAWEQVEAAGTPEVRSQKFDEVMEWTMLDRDYDSRTRDIFRMQPVFVPRWWGGFDPVYRGSASRSASATPASSQGGGRGGGSLPHLPGSDFAASIVNGVQAFSGGVIGSLTEFTSGVTQKTNPPPVTTSSGSSGGRSGGCACACACAGCACACAGGGR